MLLYLLLVAAAIGSAPSACRLQAAQRPLGLLGAAWLVLLGISIHIASPHIDSPAVVITQPHSNARVQEAFPAAFSFAFSFSCCAVASASNLCRRDPVFAVRSPLGEGGGELGWFRDGSGRTGALGLLARGAGGGKTPCPARATNLAAAGGGGLV